MNEEATMIDVCALEDLLPERGAAALLGDRQVAVFRLEDGGVRAVQQARRDAGLDISDRISLTVTGDDEVWGATVAHQDLIMRETLAAQFGSAGAAHQLPEGVGTEAEVGDKQKVRIVVKKVEGK